MKRFFNIFALVLAVAIVAIAGGRAVAQNKFEVRPVDFNKIKQITLDPKARFYYPNLMAEFKSNDTTMNFEAYRDLYYGYIFQEDYDPFRKSEFTTVVEQLYYKQTPLTRAECDSIEKYAELSLNDNIFDFDQMKYHIYALRQKKKYARADVRQFRLDRLIAAIMSSGKGTQEEPWVVIFPSHEYNLVNYLGYVAKYHNDLPGGIECITAYKDVNNATTEKKFYFDVRWMLAEIERKFPE